MLYAIKNKRTGRFLVVNAEKLEKCYDYEAPYTVAILQIRESRFAGVTFVTTDKKMAYTIAKTGKWDDELTIDMGWGDSKIELKDLEVVKLAQKKKRVKHGVNGR